MSMKDESTKQYTHGNKHCTNTKFGLRLHFFYRFVKFDAYLVVTTKTNAPHLSIYKICVFHKKVENVKINKQNKSDCATQQIHSLINHRVRYDLCCVGCYAWKTETIGLCKL